MIPKVIHYCWFGRKPLPPLAVKCIKSWKKYLPDYEIKEWNEDNFDVNSIAYTKEAYEAKRYAFVSDYARFWVLYNYGGLYFDTDVEIIKHIDDIISKGGFMGCETFAQKNVPLYVAPGLGLGCEKGHPIYHSLLQLYSGLHFIGIDGKPYLKTIVQYTTEYLVQLGLNEINEIQYINGIYIYPKEYFNPYDVEQDKIFITSQTRTIHHFAASWKTPKERFIEFIEKKMGSSPIIFIHKMKQLFLGK